MDSKSDGPRCGGTGQVSLECGREGCTVKHFLRPCPGCKDCKPTEFNMTLVDSVDGVKKVLDSNKERVRKSLKPSEPVDVDWLVDYLIGCCVEEGNAKHLWEHCECYAHVAARGIRSIAADNQRLKDLLDELTAGENEKRVCPDER